MAPHGHRPDRGADGGCSGACTPSRRCASTATGPASGRPRGPSTGRCRCCKPGRALPVRPAHRRQGSRTTCCANRAPAALKAQLAADHALRRGAVRARARRRAAGHARAARRPEGAPAQGRRRRSPTRDLAAAYRDELLRALRRAVRPRRSPARASRRVAAGAARPRRPAYADAPPDRRGPGGRPQRLRRSRSSPSPPPWPRRRSPIPALAGRSSGGLGGARLRRSGARRIGQGNHPPATGCRRTLTSRRLARHLAARGFGALLSEIDRAAAKSGAPFLRSDVTLARARSQWSHAFEVLNRMAALE